MSEPVIRRLGQDDQLDAAIGLLVRFFREEGFDTANEVIGSHAVKLAGLETCGLFAAMAGGDTIAVATVSMEFGIEYGWWAEMGDLYVVPEWRGRGLSRRMVAAVEAFLTDRGVSGYQVTVTPYAEDSHGLSDYYRTLGFDAEGRVILMKSLKT